MKQPLASINAFRLIKMKLSKVSFLTCACLILGLSHTNATSRSARPNPYKQMPVSERLDMIFKGEMPNPDRLTALEKAGATGDKTLVPKLKAILQLPDIRRSNISSFAAMLSIWKLGEPREYFLRLAEKHVEGDWASCWAMHLLASDPQEDVFGLIKNLKVAPRDLDFRNAINHIKDVSFYAKSYNETKTAGDRFQLLIPHVLTGDRNSPHEGGHPVSLWAKNQFFQLSKEYPQETAELLLAFQLEAPSRNGDGSWKGYISTLMSGEARVIFEKERAKLLAQPDTTAQPSTSPKEPVSAPVPRQ